jgi:hypothetical protein
MRSSMIRWPINTNELELEFVLSVKERRTLKEVPLIDSAHLKGVITDAQQHPT